MYYLVTTFTFQTCHSDRSEQSERSGGTRFLPAANQPSQVPSQFQNPCHSDPPQAERNLLFARSE